jgi:protein ImuB
LLVREFPAQALLRLRRDLGRQPCVVMQGEPPLQTVVSINKASRILGLAHGMSKAEVESFPAVAVLRRSLKEETATRAVLLECAGNFSPRIEHCGEGDDFLCVLDISGTEKLLGPPQELAKNLMARVHSLGIAGSIAISCNFYTAIAMARGTAPRGIRVIHQGGEMAALAAQPLTVLPLTPEQTATFSLWGVRTLGELAALPETPLVSRMGQAGRRLRQMARGDLPHLLEPIDPVFALEETIEMDSPVEDLDSLLFAINAMLEHLILRATARALAPASITIHLTLEGGALHSRTVRPALPGTDRRLWLKLLHLELEAHPPQAAIHRLTLKAEPGSTSKMQLGLFSPQLPEASRLDVTLARIRAFVGEGNVGCPVLKDAHSIDAFHMGTFRISASQLSSPVKSQPRPAMRMLRPPEPMRVTLQQGYPQTFTFRETQYSVEHAYGPWAVSGEWWVPTLWTYEQWDLVARADNEQMLCCCVVHDAIQDAWQMMALYD